jgi:hypothetical protein
VDTVSPDYHIHDDISVGDILFKVNGIETSMIPSVEFQQILQNTQITKCEIIKSVKYEDLRKKERFQINSSRMGSMPILFLCLSKR